VKARVWHDQDIPDRPWRYIVRVPGPGRGFKVIGGAARTHPEALEQLRAIWVEHSPEREAS